MEDPHNLPIKDLEDTDPLSSLAAVSEAIVATESIESPLKKQDSIHGLM